MKSKLVLCGLAGLLLSAIYVTAQSPQSNPIKESDFEKFEKKAKQLLTASPYRITKILKSFDNDEANPSMVGKYVEEHVPPNSSRTFSENTVDGKHWKYEWIKIGKRAFERRNEEPWKKTSSSDSGSFRILDEKRSVISKKYFSEGTIVVDGKKIDVLVFFRQERITGYNVEMTCAGRTTYWYHSDGRPLKVMYDVECGDKRGINHSTGTDVYEYDPDIKIEAPIK